MSLVCSRCRPCWWLRPLPKTKLPDGHYKLTGVKVIPIERTEKGSEKSGRLTKAIRFDILPEYEIVKGTESQPFRIANPTVSEKSTFTLDKPVKFKGEEVAAGTNLLKYKKFDGSRFNVQFSELFPVAAGEASIKQDFEVPADTYNVKFSWTTDQGETFSQTVKVYIDVDLTGKR